MATIHNFLVIVMVALVPIWVSVTVSTQSNRVEDCLEQFKQVRNQEYPIGGWPSAQGACKSMNPELVHQQYLLRWKLDISEGIVLKLELACRWIIEEIMTKYESTEFIDHSKLESYDDHFPYCKLMTFEQTGQFLDEFQVDLLNDPNWTKRINTERFLRSPLQKCIREYKLVRDYLEGSYIELARLFSNGLLSSACPNGDIDNRGVFKFVTRGCPRTDTDMDYNRYAARLKRAQSTIDSLVDKRLPRRTEHSRSYFTNRVENDLRMGCDMFIEHFKGVFQSDYMRENADSLVEEFMDKIEHNEDVKNFVGDMQTYLHCFAWTMRWT